MGGLSRCPMFSFVSLVFGVSARWRSSQIELIVTSGLTGNSSCGRHSRVSHTAPDTFGHLRLPIHCFCVSTMQSYMRKSCGNSSQTSPSGLWKSAEMPLEAVFTPRVGESWRLCPRDPVVPSQKALGTLQPPQSHLLRRYLDL